MAVTLMFEPWSRFYPECMPLWQAHYEEFRPFHGGRFAMSPDVERFQALDASGRLLLLVIRAAGEIVGFFMVAIQRHPHYATIAGFEDSYYIRRDWRKGPLGARLFSTMLAELERRNVRPVYIMSKDAMNAAGTLLERLGGKRTDSLYTFWFDGEKS